MNVCFAAESTNSLQPEHKTSTSVILAAAAKHEFSLGLPDDNEHICSFIDELLIAIFLLFFFSNSLQCKTEPMQVNA